MKSHSKTTNIFQSAATYFNSATKKWESGSFTLNKNHIQFIHNTDKKDQFHLCLPLSTITAIDKKQSNLIYPALVVSVGAEKHWFASFNSRDATYNMLELFWRESLISKPHKTPTPMKNISSSSLSKELFDILNESECTLIGTVNTLADQNRQLYEAEENVEDLNDDLQKAEESIENLSFPLTLPIFQSRDKGQSEKRMQKYQVTFSFSNSEDKTDWEKGNLIITSDLILLKHCEKVIMQVTKDELESLDVLSPWELCITHTFSGLQKTCFLMCPQLSRVLKFISSMPTYKNKISYAEDNSSSYETASCSSRSSSGSTRTSPASPGAESTSSKKYRNSSQTQLHHSLTEEDIEQLKSVLQNLQTLATEVGREQENQLHRIDTLADNMEKTEVRMKNAYNLAKK